MDLGKKAHIFLYARTMQDLIYLLKIFHFKHFIINILFCNISSCFAILECPKSKSMVISREAFQTKAVHHEEHRSSSITELKVSRYDVSKFVPLSGEFI